MFRFKSLTNKRVAGMAELRYQLLHGALPAECRVCMEAAGCVTTTQDGTIVLVRPEQYPTAMQATRGMAFEGNYMILTGGYWGSPAFWCDVLLRAIPHEMRPLLRVEALVPMVEGGSEGTGAMIVPSGCYHTKGGQGEGRSYGHSE